MIRIGPKTVRRIEGHFAMNETGKRQLQNVKGEVMIQKEMRPVEAAP